MSNWLGSAVDEACLLRQVGGDPDARAGQRAHHLADGPDAVADGEHLGLQRLPTGEGQQLSREPSGTVDRVGDRADVALATFFREIRSLQQVRGGLDDGQQVVEVVRDASGQLADRLHLLRLAELLLHSEKLGRRGLLAGHVTAAGIDEPALRRRDPGDPTVATILVEVARLIGRNGLRRAVRQDLRARGLMLGMVEVEVAPSDDLLGLPAQDGVPCLVRRADDPRPIHHRLEIL